MYRKLPDKERSRLKKALRAALPEDAGDRADCGLEGASEEQLASDVARLAATWRASTPDRVCKGPEPALFRSRIWRSVSCVTSSTEDFAELIVPGTGVQDTSRSVGRVAPELSDRIKR